MPAVHTVRSDANDLPLFVLTADENDHYAGGPPLSACDGVNTPCTYTAGSVGPNTVGEILTNIKALLGQADPTLDFAKTPFDIHFDMAPAFYISGQPARESAMNAAPAGTSVTDTSSKATIERRIKRSVLASGTARCSRESAGRCPSAGAGR